MKLPDVRAQLLALAADIEAAGLAEKAQALRQLAEETRRRRPVKRARAHAHKMTKVVADRIRSTARQHPDWSNRRIGLYCGVDGGRVSEVLAGFRE